MFNIFSTLNQNLQNFGGDAYDAYQAGKSKVGNVASTINTNLQNFGGDVYDVGSTIKKNVSNFATNTANTGKQVANQIGNNVSNYVTQQVNEIKAIPSQIGRGVDSFKQGVSDANYNMWNSGLKSITGKNNSTLTEAFPNAYNDLSKNTGKADEDKIAKFVDEIMKGGYNQDQALQILDSTLAEQPDFFNKKTPFDRVRQTAANRGREFGKTYEDFSTGKIGFGEATLRNAGDIIATPFGVMSDAAMSIPGVETAVGKVGEVVTSIPGVKPGMEAYSKFSEANPRAAQNIEAFTNLGLSALGITQGQALMKQGTKAVGRKVAQGADYLDNVTSPLTTPIANIVSKAGEKLKNVVTPASQGEKVLKASGLKTVPGKIGDQVVDIPSYGVMEKGRSIIAPKDTQVLAGRALSPRGAGLTDKQKLASVANAEKNVRQYHSLVRTGKLKGDLTDLQTTAQSVVDNIDEVGAKIGDAVKKVNARVEIADDSYKAISDAIKAKGASRTPTAKILQNFVEDTSDGLTLQEAFDIKKIYQAEIKKLIASKDAGTPQYGALVKGVDDLSNQIDTAIETQLKGAKFKNLKSQYKLLKSMVGDITNSAMVEGRRAPQTFTEQLGTIQAMGDFISSPLATGKQFLAKEIGELNTRGGSWKELVKRLDNEAVSAYKKANTKVGKVIQREMDNLPKQKPPIVPKAKPKATTESPFKNNKGFISPSEIKKSLIPTKGIDEATQFYDDLVYAGNSPIVAQRETAKKFGTIRAMSASKAGTMDISKAPDALVQEAKKYKSADEFVSSLEKKGKIIYHGTDTEFDTFDIGKSGLSTKAESAKKAIFFTDDKDIARGYGEFASERKIREMYDEIEKLQNQGKWDLSYDLEQKAEELSGMGYKEPIIKKSFIDTNNIATYDAKGQGFLQTDKKINDLIDKARKDGKDVLVVKNLVDNVYSDSTKASTHTIVLNPKVIKTESQLKQIYEQANKTKVVPNKN